MKKVTMDDYKITKVDSPDLKVKANCIVTKPIHNKLDYCKEKYDAGCCLIPDKAAKCAMISHEKDFCYCDVGALINENGKLVIENNKLKKIAMCSYEHVRLTTEDFICSKCGWQQSETLYYYK